MRMPQVLAAVSAAFFALTSVSVADPSPINVKRVPPASFAAAAAELAAPKPNPMELIYVPVTPCRLFNTGAVGGRIPQQKSRDFQVTGTASLAGQGGSSSGCGIPAAAAAISMTLTALDGTAVGFLTAYPAGTTVPSAASLWYPVSTVESGNPIAGLSADGKLAIFARTPANAVGDVTGYYLPQIQVYMNYDGTAYAATTRILLTEKLGTGSYRIQVDRNLQLCSVHVNIDGGYYYGSAYPSGDSIYVQTWAISGGTATATDLYHNVSAKC